MREKNGVQIPESMYEAQEMDQSDEYVTIAVESLEAGDRFYVNDRQSPLEVTHIKWAVADGRYVEEEPTQDGTGTFYPARIVCAEGNGTEYELTVPDSRNSVQINWPSLNHVKDVIFIAIEGKEQFAVSDVSAGEFIEPTIKGFDELEEYDTSSLRAPVANENKCGTCPDCNAPVVEEADMRIICTGCGLWCWKSQWERYKQ